MIQWLKVLFGQGHFFHQDGTLHSHRTKIHGADRLHQTMPPEKT
jgi:hypothetical protein